MAKPKSTQKLKVYRTPIGFHDAYVAAPSQKAALEAWGVDTNLFARGSAEPVTDAELMKVPLENPGQVVKVLRGTKEEQLSALTDQSPERSPRSRPSRASNAEVVPKKPTKRPPNPSRSGLTKAERALEKLEERQRRQLAAIEKQQRELERKLRDLQRRHEREHDKARTKLDEAQSGYDEALRRHESG